MPPLLDPPLELPSSSRSTALLDDALLDVELPTELLELLLPPGHVVPPGSQPVPQLTVWQW